MTRIKKLLKWGRAYGCNIKFVSRTKLFELYPHSSGGFCKGRNIVINREQTKEELLFTLVHELGHNILVG